MSKIESKLSNIKNIQFAFGHLSEPIPHKFEKIWKSEIPIFKQVHGTRSCSVSVLKQNCDNADALYSQVPGITLGIQTADCLPILMAHQKLPFITAIHAGWRGLYDGILEQTLNALRQAGTQTQDWVACIGPSIRECCFEVSPELLDQFLMKFQKLPSLDPDDLVSKPRHIHLPYLAKSILRAEGLVTVDEIKECTHCFPGPKYCSYRRDSKANPDAYQRHPRQWSMIRINTQLNRSSRI